MMFNGGRPLLDVKNIVAVTFVYLSISLCYANVRSAVAPILDIENESEGYVGTIGERNVLVDLKPHLQIKNIDAINGICSYHVFKPNNEEFPFTIDIKDKTTGEAVIEVLRKEVTDTGSDTSADSTSDVSKKIVLDCNKRKSFNFLIQAHDCSTPSLPSNKVPVVIQVIDHDDYVLKFEQSSVYKKKLVESDEIYENFMSIKARDEDCTNEGYACSYKLLTKDFFSVDSSFAFKIDDTGVLSSTRALKAGEEFEFKVRAFDCLNNHSFVDASVHITVVEKCVPQWTNYPLEILSTLESTNILDTIRVNPCDEQLGYPKSAENTNCPTEMVESVVTFNLDPSVVNNCQQKCDDAPIVPVATTTTSKVVLFSGQTVKTEDNEDDDNIEDDDNQTGEQSDENKIVPAGLNDGTEAQVQAAPTSFISFSKEKNVRKINFDGKFSDKFVLSAWLRRPATADRNIKQHVFCGTDSKTMNRHHFGLYFYRGNLKFLLRREPIHAAAAAAAAVVGATSSSSSSAGVDSNEVFYPSLWEWSLDETLLNDGKWHYYEVKFSYPNASLYIDGVKFAENTTNSDIIDAYELTDATDVGTIITYVGACYHARTQSLIDHFEGDIGSVILSKSTPKSSSDEVKPEATCRTICNEFIELNLADGGNNVQSSSTANKNEITLKTTNLNEMANLLAKIAYVNKDTYPKSGVRSIKLKTTIRCLNTGKQIQLKDIDVNIKVKHAKKEYEVKLDGDRQLFASKTDLENGIEPFKDISVVKTLLNKDQVDYTSSSEELAQSSGTSDDVTKFSQCQIKIVPERNLMAPSLNNEKVMFLQTLLDEFGLKFEESLNTVLITGVRNAENYETFLRRLTYVIVNINEVEASNLALIKNKRFYITCTRVDPIVNTNTILIMVNLTQEVVKNIPGFIAYKQADKYIVSDNDEDILKEKGTMASLLSGSDINSSSSNPMVVAIIVMSACAIGFVLVFALIKLHTSKSLFSKRKSVPNEENPQMEWDDSGLNITENPLDTLEISKECMNGKLAASLNRDEFTSSEEDDDEDELNDEDDEEEEDDDGPDGGQFSSEEEPEKIVDRELEWDDTSLELKLKDKKLQQQQQLQQIHLQQQQQQQQQQQLNSNLSNKSASSFIDPNKFV